MAKKKLIIPVFFFAQHGGLHEYVVATIEAALNSGWDVGIICRDGEFLNERLNGFPIEKFAIDYEDDNHRAHAIDYLTTADVIHAHPGASREIAVEASKRSGVPVVMTLHGRWTDAVYRYHKYLNKIICVSEAVSDLVKSYNINVDDKLLVVPNGVRLPDNWLNKIENTYSIFERINFKNRNKKIITVVSRYDSDKRVLVDLIKGLFKEQRIRGERRLVWNVVGDGSILNEIKDEAQVFVDYYATPLAEFKGWLNEDKVLEEISKSCACLASGRGAIQALSMGKPTIAAASVGCEVILNKNDFIRASYSNFGGLGAETEYDVQVIFDEMLSAAINPQEGFGYSARKFIEDNYDQEKLDRRLIDVYESALLKPDAHANAIPV
ncbi:glycosyltransferase family 4 protein [Brucella intermedia]|uniref:glycosyltransferase family 4 protein n=1 Tax=Brucella intermedia TaxID=94625 RepID=UPI00178C54FF|nr:glycosyltransferase family 4 protein [Brucella intermedia]